MILLVAAFLPATYAAGLLRELPGAVKVDLPLVPREQGLDSLATRGFVRGYELYRKKESSIVLLKPATLQEANLAGWTETEGKRKRITIEVYERRGSLRAIGIMELVSDIGAVGEKTLRIDRRQPYRNELRDIMRAAQATLRTR